MLFHVSLIDFLATTAFIVFARKYATDISLTFTLLCFLGIDILSSLSAAATAIAVVGPGLSNEIGPSGNFSQFPDAAKWTLSLAMIIGRIEFFAVLILFIPSFWRK